MAEDIVPEVKQVAKTETPVEAPVKAEETKVVTEDRTGEQFKKLTESNKRLLEANRILQENLLRQKQTATVPTVEPQKPSLESFMDVDPVTGEKFANTEKLQKVIEATNERAVRAETAVQQYAKAQEQAERTRQAIEQQKQEREAFEAFPAVNPSSERFDRELSKRTEALLLHSYMHPEDYGGFALSFKQAAEQAQGQSPAQAKATEKVVEQAKKEEPNTKEQMTAEARGVSSANVAQPGEEEELTKLRQQSRYGRGDSQTWAIAQRLSKVTHTGAPSSKEG